ncbi:HD domain-containing protein [Candidatus Pacearchaeota archaeon]|nr:HD domain-containing protein [Candidatus Pacearchaeota archaeon]
MKTREEALELLNKWVKLDGLKRHCLGVAACMEAYAEKNNLNDEEKDKWWICGLLHDFDWEAHPSLDKHPVEGVKVLREKGVDENICEAILGHGEHTGVKRKSAMAKTLFAVDELSGLVTALAKVRSGNFEGMSANSVRKAMKKKEFASAINREDIMKGIEELDVDETEHFELVIKALEKIKGEIGFDNQS